MVNSISENLDWQKYPDQLAPAIIQHALTGVVLMLGYMSREALIQTESTKKVTFFSRSKNRIWVKGETSGNTLELVSLALDCDKDAILAQVLPHGPTCHTGMSSCFGEEVSPLLMRLEKTIQSRFPGRPNYAASSYVSKLVDSGLDRVIQKVGEEAVEAVIAAKNTDEQKLISESADLVFHLLILLKARGLALAQIFAELKSRERG